jgi:lipoprotein-anchoring transpeptidase ErfK/SrfK
MHLPRALAAAAAACVLAATMPQLAQTREIVGFSGNYSSGTFVVKTNERAVYYVLGNGKAVRYPVGVDRIGKQWTGTAYTAANSCARPGRLRPKSSATNPCCGTSFPAEVPAIPWGQLR